MTRNTRGPQRGAAQQNQNASFSNGQSTPQQQRFQQRTGVAANAGQSQSQTYFDNNQKIQSTVPAVPSRQFVSGGQYVTNQTGGVIPSIANQAASNAAASTAAYSTNVVQVPIKPDPPITKPESADVDLSTIGEDGEKKRRWIRGINRKRPSLREKRIRQNNRLRKLLTPKNALMALNELSGITLSDYTITPKETGFLAEVLVNNVRYEGRGSSKIAAKNNASEKALRDQIIQKMAMRPRKLSVSSTKPDGKKNDSMIDDDDDIEMGDDSNAEETVPMMHLASFALYKLFNEWESDGFEVPDLKSTGIEKAVEPPKKPVRTDLPANAGTMHPSMLLSMMRPQVQYSYLGSEGQPPNILHGISLTVDNEKFFGKSKNKKTARKNAAANACNKLFGTSFVLDVSTAMDVAVPAAV